MCSKLYRRQFDPCNGSSIAKLSAWIKPGSKVFEAGPASGYMTRYLTEELGCEVSCIELSREAAKLSEPYCARMVVGNIEQIDLLNEFEGGTFDYVVFADVLEHLVDPWKVLREAKKLLKTDGECLISIPNIGFAALVVELLGGKFDYREEGLLDKTHLRFFTRSSVESLLKETGLEVELWDRTVVNPSSSEFRISLESYPKSFVETITANPDWNTYQFLVRARNSDLAHEPRLLNNQIEVLPLPEGRLVQLYWNSGVGYNESEMQARVVPCVGQSQELSFNFECESLKGIRIDPSDRKDILAIESLVLLDDSELVLFEWQGEQPLSTICGLSGLIDVWQERLMLATTLDPSIVIQDFKTDTSDKLRSYQFKIRYSFCQDIAVVDLIEKLSSTLITVRENCNSILKENELRFSALESENNRMLTHILNSNKRLEEILFNTLNIDRSTVDCEKDDSGLCDTNILINHINTTIYQKERRLSEYHYALVDKTRQIQLILDSHSWKVTAPLRKVIALTRSLRNGLKTLNAGIYGLANAAKLRRSARNLPYRPLISIILPVYNTPVKFLREAIESVLAQAYDNWELCIADDASDAKWIRPMLEKYMARDSRIKVKFRSENGHIANASNSALELAQGEFLAFLDHDDVLAVSALYSMVKCLNLEPDLDLIYSDEDKIDELGRHSQITYKAAWSPSYFMSFMYLGHLALYRKKLVEQVGGFRSGFEGSQDYDLALRVTEITDRIKHIPEVLYHWRMHRESVALNIDAKPYALEVAKSSIEDALKRRGVEGSVSDTSIPGIYRASRNLNLQKPFTILVDAFNQKQVPDAKFIKRLVDLSSSHSVIWGIADDHEWQSKNRIVGQLDFIQASNKYAFWREAIAQTSSEFVIFVDLNLVPISEDWIDSLLGQFLSSSICAVGGKIVSKHGGSVLHAGYCLYKSQLWNSFYGEDCASTGYANRLIVPHEVVAVSSKCMAVRRSALSEKGLLEKNYQTEQAFEVNLGLSLYFRNKSTVYCPYSVMKNLEAVTCEFYNLADSDDDYQFLLGKFNISEFRDPYYPAALDSHRPDFKIAV